MSEINKDCMDVIFNEARTHKYFENKPISDELFVQLYDILKLAPTFANCQAGRFVFVKSPEAKARLIPYLDPSNVSKVEAASATVIVAGDAEFYKNMPRLFPHGDYMSFFASNAAFADRTMYQNSSFQGAYLIIAARALGLDCGPMGGFDNAGVDKEFFPDGKWKSNFLCNLGTGIPSKLHPRDPRLNFNEACKII
ncbi:putative malonic semialdehyde reductase RutE [Methanosarcinaceae archaeon Ag5]|uniref:Malonic semialdehyde reductase RutE n=1 Tax=Methanolapillus africanus TaxID=3028297 RepID=A0AAE4MK88_9EURY|nr:putative malonic semialdehyde reductase RutE [Methanosarcinaceae archaeon Ag5]